jgi:hypothetical protein
MNQPIPKVHETTQLCRALFEHRVDFSNLKQYGGRWQDGYLAEVQANQRSNCSTRFIELSSHSTYLRS